MLEGHAAERAVAVANTRKVAQLARTAAELTRASKRNDAQSYLEHNRRFKFQIYELCGLEVLLDLIERLWLQVGPFMHHYSAHIGEQLKTDHHDAAVAAFRAGHAAGARRAIERDISEGSEYLLRVAKFADA